MNEFMGKEALGKKSCFRPKGLPPFNTGGNGMGRREREERSVAFTMRKLSPPLLAHPLQKSQFSVGFRRRARLPSTTYIVQFTAATNEGRCVSNV